MYAFKEKAMLDNKRKRTAVCQSFHKKSVYGNVRERPFPYYRNSFMPIQCKHKCGTEEKDVLQLKRILNIASGTDIERLMIGDEGDEVINLDRGDMMYDDIILEHWDSFSEINTVQIDENNDRIKNAEDKDTQIKREKLNKYAQRNGVDGLQSIIISKGLEREITSRRNALQDPKYGFTFGDINTYDFGDKKFDEIHMISGYGIKIQGELFEKIKSLLEPGGKFIVVGNASILKTNKLINVTDGNVITPVSGFVREITAEPVSISSRHTAGGEITDTLIKLVYTKTD